MVANNVPHGSPHLTREFLAKSAHDLRSHLTAIKGYVELVLEGGLTESEQRESLEIVLNRANVMLAFIHKLEAPPASGDTGPKSEEEVR